MAMIAHWGHDKGGPEAVHEVKCIRLVGPRDHQSKEFESISLFTVHNGTIKVPAGGWVDLKTETGASVGFYGVDGALPT